MCIQKEVIRVCGCAKPFVHDFDYPNHCLQFEERDCIRDKVYSNISAILHDCTQCPLECESIQYILTTSLSEYPSPRYANAIINANKTILRSNQFVSYEANYTVLRDSFISFTVFYPEFKYTQIIALPKITVIDLLCAIGGSLGLFIGGSALSLVEIFEIFSLIANFFFRKLTSRLRG